MIRVVAAIVALAAVAAGSAAGGTSETVTLATRQAAVSEDQRATLFGTVDSGRAEEIVTIEAKNCGLSSFTEVRSARTEAGGSWSLEYWPGVNTTLRAKWKGAVSAPIALGQRAWVNFIRSPAKGRFYVAVGGKAPVWRKRVLIQRRRSGAWKTLRSVVLTEQHAFPGSGGVSTSARFTMSLPRGTQLRAVLPLSQARPCYLAGVSDPLRT